MNEKDILNDLVQIFKDNTSNGLTSIHGVYDSVKVYMSKLKEYIELKEDSVSKFPSVKCNKCGWSTGCSYIAPDNKKWQEDDGTVVRCPMCMTYLREPSDNFKKHQIALLKERLNKKEL